MRHLLVKNWRDFQHYKHRSPPWIKLHRAITEDYAFAALKDKSKAHLILIWILASGLDGKVPYDAAYIAKRINASDPVDLDSLILAGFLIPEDGEMPVQQDASSAQASVKHVNGERRESARKLLIFLNEQTGKNFQATDANLSMIEARLGEYSEQILRGVVVDRVDEWKDDEQMRKYLRPATLFNKTKCAQYVGELPT